MNRVIKDISKITSFQEFLKADLAERQRLAPHYSMRKYADDLKTSDSSLSKFVRGQRRFSARLIQTLGRALGLKKQELAFFIGQEQAVSNDVITPSNDPKYLSISDWRYDAIRELLDGQSAELDQEQFAARLQMSPAHLIDSIEKLKKDKLLKIENGIWKNSVKNTTSILNPQKTNQAAKAYQRNILQASAKSIDEIDVSQRNHTSIMLKLNQEDMPAAIELIRKLRRQFLREFEVRDKLPSQLYGLHVGLFPLERS